MLGVLLVGSPPEIGRVGGVGIGSLEDRQRIIGWPQQNRRAAGAGGVFEGVARPTLGGIHPDRQGVVGHPRSDEADRRLDRLGAGLAGELPIGRLGVGVWRR